MKKINSIKNNLQLDSGYLDHLCSMFEVMTELTILERDYLIFNINPNTNIIQLGYHGKKVCFLKISRSFFDSTSTEYLWLYKSIYQKRFKWIIDYI